MMEWRLANLQGEYKLKTGKTMSYRMIAEATGLSKNTIMEVARGNVQRPDLETLDALLIYLANALDRPLTTDDLLRHIPSAPTSPATKRQARPRRSTLDVDTSQIPPDKAAAEAERRAALLAQAAGRGKAS